MGLFMTIRYETYIFLTDSLSGFQPVLQATEILLCSHN